MFCHLAFRFGVCWTKAWSAGSQVFRAVSSGAVQDSPSKKHLQYALTRLDDPPDTGRSRNEWRCSAKCIRHEVSGNMLSHDDPAPRIGSAVEWPLAARPRTCLHKPAPVEALAQIISRVPIMSDPRSKPSAQGRPIGSFSKGLLSSQVTPLSPLNFLQS